MRRPSRFDSMSGISIRPCDLGFTAARASPQTVITPKSATDRWDQLWPGLTPGEHGSGEHDSQAESGRRG